MSNLWYILHLPTAEPFCGAGNLSARDGFYEQFYTETALYSTKEAAKLALKAKFSSIEKLSTTKEKVKLDIIEHYEVLPYED